MVRNPVDMLPSLHSQYLFGGIEDLTDFEEALAAEPDRRNGRRIPPKNGAECGDCSTARWFAFMSRSSATTRCSGRDRVHVILFDDLTRNTEDTYKRTLEFLGADPGFVPPLWTMNPNKRVRSRHVQRLVATLLNPGSPIRRAGTRLIPVHRIRNAMLTHVVSVTTRANTSFAPRPPVDTPLRGRLAAELAPDIQLLGELLGRDLSHWYSDAPVRSGPAKEALVARADQTSRHLIEVGDPGPMRERSQLEHLGGEVDIRGVRDAEKDE